MEDIFFHHNKNSIHISNIVHEWFDEEETFVLWYFFW